MMRDGMVFELPTQAHRTTDSESSFLPTPLTVQSRNETSGRQEGSEHHGGTTLHDLVFDGSLLPTPIDRDYKDGQSAVIRNGQVAVDTLGRAVMNSGEIQDIAWGKFEPAIRRWEAIIGRAAPAPTKPDGKDGAHRLSSEFTEWMMGLPAGWITDCGLTRNEELKACGNGVVPQQAALALRMLLDRIETAEPTNRLG
jgi:DNA (cytosine-5)-methyltransferase 1